MAARDGNCRQRSTSFSSRHLPQVQRERERESERRFQLLLCLSMLPFHGARKAFGAFLMRLIPEAAVLAHRLVIDERCGTAFHALGTDSLREGEGEQVKDH